MKKVIIAGTILVISGCASTEEISERLSAKAATMCEDYGFVPGTQDFVECHMLGHRFLLQQRHNDEIARRQVAAGLLGSGMFTPPPPAPRLQTTCTTNSGFTNCW